MQQHANGATSFFEKWFPVIQTLLSLVIAPTAIWIGSTLWSINNRLTILETRSTEWGTVSSVRDLVADHIGDPDIHKGRLRILEAQIIANQKIIERNQKAIEELLRIRQ